MTNIGRGRKSKMVKEKHKQLLLSLQMGCVTTISDAQTRYHKLIKE